LYCGNHLHCWNGAHALFVRVWGESKYEYMGFAGGSRLAATVAAGVVSCLQIAYVLSICMPGACTHSALCPFYQIYITKYLDFFLVRVLFGLRIRTIVFVFHAVVLKQLWHTRYRQYQLSRERTYVLVETSVQASESEDRQERVRLRFGPRFLCTVSGLGGRCQF